VRERILGYRKAWLFAAGCFTNIALHSLKRYHQEHAKEPNRLPKDISAARGAVIIHFHGVFNLYQ